jgi:putative membrane protein
MRVFPLLLGGFVLLAVWTGTPLRAAAHSFYGHMIVHMSVVAIAAPLLAIGVAQSRWDPVRWIPSLFSPLIASLAELAIVWLWHTPLLHAAARNNVWPLIAEQATFLLSGFYLWISVCGGEPVMLANRRAIGIVALLLTAMHMTLLGALLAMSPRPLYAHVHEFSGLTPIEDQHLGGAIMILVGGASYLAGGLWLATGLLGHPKKAA